MEQVHAYNKPLGTPSMETCTRFARGLVEGQLRPL